MTDIPIKRREILRCVFRPAFPQILLVVTALVLFGSTMFDVGPDVERQKYVLFRLLVLIVAGTLLGLWAIFFSGWNKLKVSLAIAVLIGGFWGFFWVETNGDISPSSVHARNWVLRLFNARHEDDVAAQRREQAKQWKRPVELTPSENDFPGYRGADRTGVVNGPPIARDWNAHPPREVWKQLTFGGYSAFAVVNGYLFTLEQREEEEAVVCYDGTNGHELWVHSWPGKFTEAAGGTGPRTTPTVDNGEVFALGALGHLVCLDGKTGQRKWSVEVLQKNSNLKWAMSASPLVHGNLVIVNPGKQSQESDGRAVVAYDRRDGSVVWASGNLQAGYASPMLASLSGKQQILLFDGVGLAGLDPDGGCELWRFPWRTDGSNGINVAQPIVLDRPMQPGEIFIGSGYGRGGALVRVIRKGDEWSVEEVWSERTAMRWKFTSPVLHNGHAYGLDDGKMQCVDLADGKVKWTDKRRTGEGKGFGHGQLLLSGDRIIVLTETGEIVLVEATPEAFRELGRLKVLKGSKTWNNPALSDGRLYIRNHLEMACYDLR